VFRLANALRYEIRYSAHPVARARVWWAAEEAKRRLSYDPEVTVREEALVTVDGKPLHLEMEITREQYEDLIRPLIEQTLEHISKALADAGKSPSGLDAILLVGGSTRTPLVARMIQQRTGLIPREEIHPDLCVALGAGVMASRLAGHEVERVLAGGPGLAFETWVSFRQMRLTLITRPPMTRIPVPIISVAEL
jgi:molecular chaperone DnaK